MAEIERVLPVFIYDHNQITATIASEFFLKMQEEALADLGRTLSGAGSRLCKFYGTPFKIVSYLIAEWKPQYVAFNVDYSTYSMARDAKISEVCKLNAVKLLVDHDVMLGNLPFNKLFHAFSKEALNLRITVGPAAKNKFVNKTFKLEKLSIIDGSNVVPATRAWALNRIRKFCENPGQLYKDTGIPAASISAHLKLGLISCREVFSYALSKGSGYLVKQMVWREFYFSLAREKRLHYDFYDSRYKFMEWRNDPAETKAMWLGLTGYPLIDASMRELNTTGFMWNRGRLLVGWFSVKILRINPFLPLDANVHEWHMGGQCYFSKMLIDACYANNTGNWHWVASDTVDASGQRFGSGWSGRPMDIEKIKKSSSEWLPGDAEYLAKWLPKSYGKKKNVEKIVDHKVRWEEWKNLTL
jgi:deoxyribodipyrimidine photo-lyase